MLFLRPVLKSLTLNTTKHQRINNANTKANTNTNSRSPMNYRIVKLKGTNKLQCPKYPLLSISSQYIGEKDNMFGMFTSRISPKYINSSLRLTRDKGRDIYNDNDNDTNMTSSHNHHAFSQFSNRKLNSFFDNTSEQKEKFKEIPIEDVRQSKKQKLIEAMICKLTINPLESSRLFESPSFQMLLEHKKQQTRYYYPVKRYDNLNKSNTYTLRILSESELFEGKKDNISNLNVNPNVNVKRIKSPPLNKRIPILIKHKASSALGVSALRENSLRHNELIDSSITNPNEEEQSDERIRKRLILSNHHKINLKMFRSIHRLNSVSTVNGSKTDRQAKNI